MLILFVTRGSCLSWLFAILGVTTETALLMYAIFNFVYGCECRTEPSPNEPDMVSASHGARPGRLQHGASLPLRSPPSLGLVRPHHWHDVMMVVIHGGATMTVTATASMSWSNMWPGPCRHCCVP